MRVHIVHIDCLMDRRRVALMMELINTRQRHLVLLIMLLAWKIRERRQRWQHGRIASTKKRKISATHVHRWWCYDVIVDGVGKEGHIALMFGAVNEMKSFVGCSLSGERFPWIEFQIASRMWSWKKSLYLTSTLSFLSSNYGLLVFVGILKISTISIWLCSDSQRTPGWKECCLETEAKYVVHSTQYHNKCCKNCTMLWKLLDVGGRSQYRSLPRVKERKRINAEAFSPSQSKRVCPTTYFGHKTFFATPSKRAQTRSVLSNQKAKRELCAS